MASFDILHIEHNNSSSGSFPSEEYSFLPEVSVRPDQNGVSNHINENFELTNMQSALFTASPEISVEDIHSRLIEVLQENQSLKEALNKNNALMRDQMGTISAWREQMLQSKSQQLQTLERAKENITLLKEENATLQEQLSSIEKECHELKNRKSCDNCKSLETVMQSLRDDKDSAEKLKSILVGELQDRDIIQDKLREDLEAIHHYLNNLLHARKISRKEREELNGVIQSLTAQIISLSKNFCANIQTDEETGYVVVNRSNQSIEDILLQNSGEFNNLKMENQEKNEELGKLRKQHQEMAEKMKSYMERIQECEASLQSRNGTMSTRPDIEASLAEKYKERCESLQQQVIELQEKLERAKMSDQENIYKLREEAKSLQDILKLESLSNQKEKEKLMQKCEQLQVDYDRVTQLLEIHMKDEKKMTEEKNIQQESLAKNHMEEVDYLTAHLIDVQEKYTAQVEEVNKLTEELSTLKDEAETIPMLKTQIQVFKQDLEHAVVTRDTAYAEIEKLEKELRRYKRRDSDSTSMRKSSSPKMGYAAVAGIVIENCPVCDMGFEDINALQNHVDRCLAENCT